MAIVNQVITEVLHVVARQLEGRNGVVSQSGTSTSTPVPAPTTSLPTMSSTPANQNGGGGPTSSPLLFFVALGFGVVFTNLWIIVGVKYCFRYNARNRAIRNGEEVDPINLENMPARPHRRRREKKLMTMDEVNERFPLTKYKNWVASRAREGLPTSGGVTTSPSRAGSVRDVDKVVPQSPVGTKHSVNSRPATAASDAQTPEITGLPVNQGTDVIRDRKSIEGTVVEKENASAAVEEANNLEEVRTTATTVDKHATVASVEDEDDDDHIHTAVPPELLTNPGDSCAICIDTLEADDDIRGLTCGHAFHAGCLDPWLTSRRACCPLCKADYYTPKPRSEGEANRDTDRATRRREARMNMPQPPQSAWTGIRGSPRLLLPTRFGTSGSMYDRDQYYDQARRQARRTRRQPGAASDATSATQETTEATENEEAAAPRRWRPRISNPFSSMSMPAMRLPGRNRQASTPAEQNTATEPSPSQLEAGVVR